MNINKLWHCITKLEPKYHYLINEVISCFLQEIINPEAFYDNGIRHVSSYQLIQEIENTLSKRLAIVAQNCAIEFCITNEYIIKGQTWNCIEHLLENYTELLTAKNKKYLKALNNSYLGIYRVVSLVPGKSVVLEDIIESNVNHVTVLDKYLSETIIAGQIIAVRLIAIKYKAKPTEYQISSTLILLPERIAIQSVEIIKTLTDAMNDAKASVVLIQKTIEDNAHNLLLQKKMWTKEILEQWYLYYANYKNYHEIFDYEGNPWCPCQVVFDIIVN